MLHLRFLELQLLFATFSHLQSSIQLPIFGLYNLHGSAPWKQGKVLPPMVQWLLNPSGDPRLIKVCLASLIHSSGTFSSHQRLMVAAGSWLKKKSWKNPRAPVHHYQQWPFKRPISQTLQLLRKSISTWRVIQSRSFSNAFLFTRISARCHWRGYSIRGRFLSRTCLLFFSHVFVPCFKDRANGAYFISAKKSTSQTGTAV